MAKELKDCFVDRINVLPSVTINVNLDCGAGIESTWFLMSIIDLAYFDRDEYSTDEGFILNQNDTADGVGYQSGTISVCADTQAAIVSVQNVVFSTLELEAIYTCKGQWKAGYGAEGRYEIFECHLEEAFE